MARRRVLFTGGHSGNSICADLARPAEFDAKVAGAKQAIAERDAVDADDNDPAGDVDIDHAGPVG